MEESRKHSIQKLAESISVEYIYQSYVDPYSATDDYGIEVRENDYSDNSGFSPYKGVIWFRNNQFTIHLNTKVLKNCEYDFARFTCAHELGHFFITEHNILLKSGQSISFNGNDFLTKRNSDPFEQEANLFAANFLLPEQYFKQVASTFPTGLQGILDLKKHFHTSITCTAFRFVSLGLGPSMLILWKDHIKNKVMSPQFRDRIGENAYAILNPKRVLIEKKELAHEKTGVKYYSAYTTMGGWLSVGGEFRSEVVLEETILTQQFNLSLITFINGG